MGNMNIHEQIKTCDMRQYHTAILLFRVHLNNRKNKVAFL